MQAHLSQHIARNQAPTKHVFLAVMLGVLSSFCVPSRATAAEFFGLGAGTAMGANDGIGGLHGVGQISGDGSAVFGPIGTLRPTGLFRWTRETGTVDLGATFSSYRIQVSHNGDAIAFGQGGPSSGLAMWRENIGWDLIPDPTGTIDVERAAMGASSDLRFVTADPFVYDTEQRTTTPVPSGTVAMDVSEDGNRVMMGRRAGTGIAGLLGMWEKDTGLMEFSTDPNVVAVNSNQFWRTRTMSADGSVAVGALEAASSRNQEAFRWTRDGGTERLGFLPGDNTSRAVLVSSDGERVFGVSTGSSGTLFRWTEVEGMVELGWPAGVGGEDDGAIAFTYSLGGISADGRSAKTVAYTDSGQPLAFFWREGIGMRTLESMLRDEFGLGDAIEGWQRLFIADLSDDGLVLAGHGINPNGQREAWYANLRDPQPGDTNGDGVVNLNDLNNVRNHFGESGPGIPGDADGSGDVTLVDLNLVRNNFGTTTGARPVPEPGTWGLAIVAVLGMLMAPRSILRANGAHSGKSLGVDHFALRRRP